ncbi:MAG: Holliday junction branch migration protein RuvA [Actinomycetia bacterium]|nr:Holliday junction branch migration protein RuvA [Actinomycetes bacterium]MCH9800135.1 Holliday junction branch migration protein RuvA [Actinomycetes bacterium]
MIEFVRGEVHQVAATHVVVDLGGMGVRVQATPGTIADLRAGDTRTIPASLVVREDSWTLFGFADAEEREIFETVQSVSGVGPRTALALVGTLTAEGLRQAVANEDERALMKVPGIGKKGAQRILLELADRVGAPSSAELAQVASADESVRQVVESGLVSLGWSNREAETALKSVAQDQPELLASGPVAVALRAALRELQR